MNTASVGMPILLALFVANSVGATPQVARRTATLTAVPVAQVPTLDQDGDGLDDLLEQGQSSAFDRVDSDCDGWNDAEELARGSLPTAFTSQPVGVGSSVGARAYMRNGRLHTAFAVYVREGTLSGAELDIGIYVDKHKIPLSPVSYAPRMTVTTAPTHTAGALLTIVDVVLPHAPLLRNGAMSIYGTLRIGQEFVSVSALDLAMREGTPVELIHPNELSPNAAQQLGPGVLYRPLGGTQIPISWSAGEICMQRLQPVGTHGAVVTQEVTSASCVSGWDGYCDGGSCAASTGTTVDLVDPGALVGG